MTNHDKHSRKQDEGTRGKDASFAIPHADRPSPAPTPRADSEAPRSHVEQTTASDLAAKPGKTTAGLKGRGGRRWRAAAFKSIRNTVMLLVLFAAVALFSLNLLQTKLLENAHEMGDALANGYAIEEENNALVYQQVAELESLYFEKYVDAGWSDDQLTDWLYELGENMTAATPAHAIHPYAFVDGHLISSNPNQYPEDRDYADAEWYKAATAHPGEVVFTDAYEDRVTGETVITIAIAVDESPAILAFDIHPDSFGTQGSNPVSLPEGSAYYLCDASGTLLYSASKFIEGDEGMAYLGEILDGIDAGKFDSSDSYIVDPDGNRRAVYYHVAENGWISIVTVPFSTLLGDLNAFTIGFGTVFALLLALTIWQGARDFRSSRLIERTNDTVRVLGNSYYAIYRVDYRQGTYEMTKGSDYVRARLAATGAYQDLIDCILDIIEPSTRATFANDFSLDNVRTLMAKGVRDFGGDFLRLFDDRYLWVSVRLLMDESLSSGEAVLCFRIVDDEKRADLQRLQLLEDSLDVAKRSQKARNRFFSSMSHDLRTPLNAIINLSQLAEMQADDPETVRGYLKKVRASGSQMLALVNDILDVSRLEEDDAMRVQMAEFDLADCIRTCAGTFEEQAQREGKRFSCAIDVHDPLVRGDAGRLTQMLNNLLSNSFKYSNAGAEISLDVRQMSYGESHNSYRITVADTGIGMSEEFLERVFVPYERETTFSSREITGTGLGMPIVKSIVDRMDGRITVESELGKGSTFTVTVPLEDARFSGPSAESEERRQNDSADMPPAEEADRERTATKLKEDEPADGPFTDSVSLGMFAQKAAGRDDAQPEGDALSGACVLMAEDNEINREIAVEMLAMRGVEIVCAEDGLEAVKTFSESECGRFDAILMDMQMPRMNGCDAAKAIRALDRDDAKTIPIIATTANAFAEDIAATAEAGMNAHVSKPIDFQTLFSVLEEQIRAYRNGRD